MKKTKWFAQEIGGHWYPHEASVFGQAWSFALVTAAVKHECTQCPFEILPGARYITSQRMPHVRWNPKTFGTEKWCAVCCNLRAPVVRTAEEQQRMYSAQDAMGYEPFCDTCGFPADACICNMTPKEWMEANEDLAPHARAQWLAEGKDLTEPIYPTPPQS